MSADREAVFTDAEIRRIIDSADLVIQKTRRMLDAWRGALDVSVFDDYDSARSTRLYLDLMDDGPSRPPSSDPRGQRWFDLIRGWEEEPSGNDDTGDLVERCMLLADQEMTLWTKRALKAEDEVEMLVNTNEADVYVAMVEDQRARAAAAIERVKALHVCSLFFCRGCKAVCPCPTIRALEQP